MTSGPQKREILLVGFGAIGAVYSLVVDRSGLARITVVARSNFNEVNDHGMRFESKKYGEINGWKPDRLCRSVAEAADRSYDYVLVATKAVPDIITTPEILEPLLTAPYIDRFPQPTYMLLQNGINVELDLYHAVKKLGQGEPRIIDSTLYIFCNLLAPDICEHGESDRLEIGIYRHEDNFTLVNSAAELEILDGIAGILKEGGGTIEIAGEIQRKKFAKDYFNMGYATFSTLTSYTVPAFFRPPPSDPSLHYSPYVHPKTADRIQEYTLGALKATFAEMESVARALGYPDSEEGIPSSFTKHAFDWNRELHMRPDNTHVSSMLLDARKGLPIECEVIVGEVVRMARKLDVPVPRIEMLYALLLVVQNQTIRRMEEAKH
ncbi:6-phosphogluconate dehydrogenase C-terminal domain-like protein [Dendrothele bispora CBS 962.96]|uniref:6-phosphogluconate dehydrogenase C-terminal domain-like protein n=1 Tax=Dendrothele bispora (strain CBS 962.96) TaxID=1314807 RepID=A0A4S8MZM5_DENBC|nr:6-phosphogluconate dehydrogenase C-terminal domain-like protein [Dendrothele bispora CBS 962.96]